MRYVGYIIPKDKEIDRNDNHKTQASRLKWRSVIGFLCDLETPLRLKEKFIGLLLGLLSCMAQNNSYKEISCTENEYSRDIYTFLDVW